MHNSPVDLAICNTFLDLMASLNDAADHGSHYVLTEIKHTENFASTLNEFLSNEYGNIGFKNENGTIEYHQKEFNVELKNIDDDWRIILGQEANCWFFQQQFSPVIYSENSKRNVLNQFIALLSNTLPPFTLYRINLPVFGEPFICWSAYALRANDKSFLLEFGWA